MPVIPGALIIGWRARRWDDRKKDDGPLPANAPISGIFHPPLGPFETQSWPPAYVIGTVTISRQECGTKTGKSYMKPELQMEQWVNIMLTHWVIDENGRKSVNI